VIVGDLNTPMSPIDRSSRQKTNKETVELLHTLDQIDKVDIYRVFHSTVTQYTFFPAAHGTFSKMNHVLGHKANHNKFKKTEIIPCIISDHNRIKLDLNNIRSHRKIFKHMETDMYFLEAVLGNSEDTYLSPKNISFYFLFNLS
jgi:hypothetical protein